MKILLIGSGGREHALAWKLAQSDSVEKIYGAPGNPGIASLGKGQCVPIDLYDFPGQCEFIRQEGIDLTVVGPENPLAGGIVDFLSKEGHRVFGPTKAAAQLEASKSFAKEFMKRYAIPTAGYAEFGSAEAAQAYVKEMGAPVVVKADGLAAGKGVTVAHTVNEALEAIRQAMVEKSFGDAGARVIVEEFLDGEEASILAFSDGETIVPMATSQDHKAAYDHDRGPNTGGMGAYSPAPVVDPSMLGIVEDKILKPCIRGMAEQGIPYKGILYAGLMMTSSGPKVIEYNCRFGDPETQVVLPRMSSDLLPVLQACCDGTLAEMDVAYSPDPCVSVVMASGGYPGAYEKGKPITGIEDAESQEGVTVFHAGTSLDGDQLVTAGGRVLNVTATGTTIRDAVDKAYAAVAKIHFEGCQYRSDIAYRAIERMATR